MVSADEAPAKATMPPATGASESFFCSKSDISPEKRQLDKEALTPPVRPAKTPTIPPRQGLWILPSTLVFTLDEQSSSVILRVDLWGLDLLITPNLTTMLIVSDAAFGSEFYTDGGNRETYINFPCNKEVAHNILTEDLFEAFRYSLIGYLSLINGARVQISKEYYNGFSKIYSYDRIENLSRSYYTCGNAKLVRFSPILFEFDNYVRWNQVLNLNKYVHHICTAQQVLICEDSSFILILAFEGLCKNYLELQSEEKVKKYVIPLSSFDEIEKELIEVLNHYEIPSEALVKYKEGIAKLNVLNLATYKFRLLLNDLNIPETKVVKGLIRRVRSTLVHDAKLKEYTDYQLLSELIREAIRKMSSLWLTRK